MIITIIEAFIGMMSPVILFAVIAIIAGGIKSLFE